MNKKNQILSAATKVFFEKGAAKATFGDIAKAAGISRPTLYTSFEDKNALLIETIYYTSEQMLAEVSARLITTKSITERLELFVQITILDPFELIQKSQDARDILSGHNEEGKEAIRKTLEARALYLADLLKPFAKSTSDDDLLAQARVFVLASAGLKNVAASKDDLAQSIEQLSLWLRMDL